MVCHPEDKDEDQDKDEEELGEEEDENDEEDLSAIAQPSGSSTSLKVNPSLHGGGSRWRAKRPDDQLTSINRKRVSLPLSRERMPISKACFREMGVP